jgi:hypothetical protein
MPWNQAAYARGVEVRSMSPRGLCESNMTTMASNIRSWTATVWAASSGDASERAAAASLVRRTTRLAGSVTIRLSWLAT